MPCKNGEATDKTLLLLTCIDLRYLPPKEQIDAVRGAGKRSFIAGTTVSGNVPDNWQKAADVGIDGILTEFPLELRAMLRKMKVK